MDKIEYMISIEACEIQNFPLIYINCQLFVQLLQLSGILTVFFCGILMSHYAWYDMTDSSRITTRYVEKDYLDYSCIMGHTLMLNYEQYITSCRHVFATMSFIAETFIFLYVGMDALDIEKWKMTKLGY